VFRRADLRRVPYDGPDGIRALLEGMTRFGWKPVVEKGNIIGLSNDSQCSITLEPGGQFELSGAPLATLHQTCGEVHEHLRKVRVSLALQPVAVALFANSPFIEGRPSGFQTYRSFVWTNTDPDRCGTLPFVFEDGFGFERYVDYMLDVPMYFVYRDGNYIDAR